MGTAPTKELAGRPHITALRAWVSDRWCEPRFILPVLTWAPRAVNEVHSITQAAARRPFFNLSMSGQGARPVDDLFWRAGPSGLADALPVLLHERGPGNERTAPAAGSNLAMADLQVQQPVAAPTLRSQRPARPLLPAARRCQLPLQARAPSHRSIPT